MWEIKVNPSCANGDFSLPASQAHMTAFWVPLHPISAKDHSTHWISSKHPRPKLSKSLLVATIPIKMIILTTGMLFRHKTWPGHTPATDPNTCIILFVCIILLQLLCVLSACSMYTTSKLNLIIGEIIQEVISNLDTEHSKITVESFQCKKDCLVIIKIWNWSENHHFLKSAVSIKPCNIGDLNKLRTLFSHLEAYCRK